MREEERREQDDVKQGMFFNAKNTTCLANRTPSNVFCQRRSLKSKTGIFRRIESADQAVVITDKAHTVTCTIQVRKAVLSKSSVCTAQADSRNCFDSVKARIESFIGLRSNPMTSTFYNFPREARPREPIEPT